MSISGRKALLLSFAIVTSLASDDADTAVAVAERFLRCPYNWLVFGNSSYFLILEPTTWFEAMTICLAYGGSLAEIHSASENHFVNSISSKHGTPWIGLHDFKREGQFVWASSFQTPTYRNWNVDEPNNIGEEDCTEMLSTGLWNDQSCRKYRIAVCESDCHSPKTSFGRARLVKK